RVSLSLLEKPFQAGLALIQTWLKGKTILVVGQSRAGKSTFIDYLQHGIFEDEQDTPRTVEKTKTSHFKVGLGKDKTLEMIVKTVEELPGQVGPTEHANTAFKERPDAIVLVTDLTTPLRGEVDRA